MSRGISLTDESPSRAAVFEGTRGQLTLLSVPRPAPGSGELLVDVLGCTLCGSDLHTIEGRRRVATPTVLGHEIVGRIAAFGDPDLPWLDLGGETLAIGDRIVWAIVASCGACPACHRGLPQKCQRGVKYGHEQAVDRRVLTGGLADACLLAGGTSIVKLPAGMPLEVACPAGCATATVAAAVEPAGKLAGRTVAVFGLGLLGLTACAMVQTQGAANVIAIDPSPARRARATAFGATAVLEPGGLDSHDLAERLDLAIEVSGSPAAVSEAIAHATVGGGIHLVGSVAPAGSVAIDPERIVRRLLTIRGIHNYAPRHLLAAVRFLDAQRDAFPFLTLVDRWYSLDASAEAFAEAIRSQAVRVGVRPERPLEILPGARSS